MLSLSSADFFQNYFFFKKFLQEYYQSVKRFEFRLLAKVVSRRQKSAKKELKPFVQTMKVILDCECARLSSGAFPGYLHYIYQKYHVLAHFFLKRNIFPC